MLLPLSALALFGSVTHSPSKIEEIRKDWAELQPRYFDEPYQKPPLLSPPYQAGSLKPEFHRDGVNFLRFVRKLAGLPFDIESKPELDEKAQCGSVLLTKMAAIAHQAPMPPDMDENFYSLASQGIGQGNVSRQLGSAANLPQLLYDQLLDNRENAAHCGHRRWILNPRLKYVGMGFVTHQGGNRNEGVLIANDLTRSAVPFGHVAWPAAGDFPLEFCPEEIPWSVTLDPETYQTPKPGAITVVWSQVGSSTTITFKPGLKPEGQYFSVINLQNYGVSNAIIFRPPVSHVYNSGDEYKVEIRGLTTKAGAPTTLSYSVKLFPLSPEN